MDNFFGVILSDDFKKKNRTFFYWKRKWKDQNREGEDSNYKGEDCKIVKVYKQRRGKKEMGKREDLMQN